MPPPVCRCSSRLTTKKSEIRHADAVGCVLKRDLPSRCQCASRRACAGIRCRPGGRISRVTTSIASGAGRPALTARTIRSSASGKTSRNRRWYRLCVKAEVVAAERSYRCRRHQRRLPVPAGTAPRRPPSRSSTAEVIPEAARRRSPMRLPIAARARSRCRDARAGNTLRCGNGLRSDTSGLPVFEAARKELLSGARGSPVGARRGPSEKSSAQQNRRAEDSEQDLFEQFRLPRCRGRRAALCRGRSAPREQ